MDSGRGAACCAPTFFGVPYRPLPSPTVALVFTPLTHAVALPSGESMLALLVAVSFAVQQPPPPPPDTSKRDSLPLKMDRTVSFETSEGTWLSLDVSPDGKTIVFELLGDLYTMPIAGGAATRISGGMAFDSQPKFSPDGKWIAFLSDREGSDNIWIIHPDGTGAK